MENVKIFVFTKERFGTNSWHLSREVPTIENINESGRNKRVRRIKTKGETRKVRCGDEVVYKGKRFVVGVVNGHTLTIKSIPDKNGGCQVMYIPDYKVRVRVKREHRGMVLRINKEGIKQ
jgi:hypothetical protein